LQSANLKERETERERGRGREIVKEIDVPIKMPKEHATLL